MPLSPEDISDFLHTLPTLDKAGVEAWLRARHVSDHQDVLALLSAITTQEITFLSLDVVFYLFGFAFEFWHREAFVYFFEQAVKINQWHAFMLSVLDRCEDFIQKEQPQLTWLHAEDIFGYLFAELLGDATKASLNRDQRASLAVRLIYLWQGMLRKASADTSLQSLQLELCADAVLPCMVEAYRQKDVPYETEVSEAITVYLNLKIKSLRDSYLHTKDKKELKASVLAKLWALFFNTVELLTVGQADEILTMLFGDDDEQLRNEYVKKWFALKEIKGFSAIFWNAMITLKSLWVDESHQGSLAMLIFLAGLEGDAWVGAIAASGQSFYEYRSGNRKRYYRDVFCNIANKPTLSKSDFWLAVLSLMVFESTLIPSNVFAHNKQLQEKVDYIESWMALCYSDRTKASVHEQQLLAMVDFFLAVKKYEYSRIFSANRASFSKKLSGYYGTIADANYLRGCAECIANPEGDHAWVSGYLQRAVSGLPEASSLQAGKKFPGFGQESSRLLQKQRPLLEAAALLKAPVLPSVAAASSGAPLASSRRVRDLQTSVHGSPARHSALKERLDESVRQVKPAPSLPVDLFGAKKDDACSDDEGIGTVAARS